MVTYLSHFFTNFWGRRKNWKNMEALVLDKNYDTVAMMDAFETFIWTERYNQYGDFELLIPATLPVFEFLKRDNYMYRKGTKTLMVIEDLEITTDVDDGDHLIVTGRSLESILDRRIVWGRKTLSGNFQNAIKTLLNENIIAPSNTKRKIPGFIFSMSDDPAITSLTLDTELYGDNLYDAISSLCVEKDVGFRVWPHGEGGFEFKLYAGKNRSYSQEDNPWVVFSPKYDNFLSSDYFESGVLLKTDALARCEETSYETGENGESLSSTIIYEESVHGKSGEKSGLERRELFVDVGRLSDDGDTSSQLQQKGKEALAETDMTISFEGEIEASQQYVYGKDFFMGDVVQVVNDYGKEANSRITELIISQDQTGEKTTPTFSAFQTEDSQN